MQINSYFQIIYKVTKTQNFEGTTQKQFISDFLFGMTLLGHIDVYMCQLLVYNYSNICFTEVLVTLYSLNQWITIQSIIN